MNTAEVESLEAVLRAHGVALLHDPAKMRNIALAAGGTPRPVDARDVRMWSLLPATGVLDALAPPAILGDDDIRRLARDLLDDWGFDRVQAIRALRVWHEVLRRLQWNREVLAQTSAEPTRAPPHATGSSSSAPRSHPPETPLDEGSKRPAEVGESVPPRALAKAHPPAPESADAAAGHLRTAPAPSSTTAPGSIESTLPIETAVGPPTASVTPVSRESSVPQAAPRLSLKAEFRPLTGSSGELARWKSEPPTPIRPPGPPTGTPSSEEAPSSGPTEGSTPASPAGRMAAAMESFSQLRASLSRPPPSAAAFSLTKGSTAVPPRGNAPATESVGESIPGLEGTAWAAQAGGVVAAALAAAAHPPEALSGSLDSVPLPRIRRSTVSLTTDDWVATPLSLGAEKTLHVDPLHGPIKTLVEAVNNATPGTLILLKPGTYRERLRIAKAVEISGEGPAGSIIVENPQGPVLDISAPVVLRGLTISLTRPRGATGKAGVHALRAPGAIRVDGEGQLTLDDAVVMAETGPGLDVKNGQVRAMRTHFRANASDRPLPAVLVRTHGRLDVERCDIRSMGGDGVAVTDHSEIKLTDCRIHACGRHGIVLDEESVGLAERTQIVHCKGTGLIAKGGSARQQALDPRVGDDDAVDRESFRLRQCVLRNHGGGGLLVDWGARVVGRQLRLLDNVGFGAMARQGGEFSLTGGLVRGSATGVVAGDDGSGPPTFSVDPGTGLGGPSPSLAPFAAPAPPMGPGAVSLRESELADCAEVALRLYAGSRGYAAGLSVRHIAVVGTQVDAQARLDWAGGRVLDGTGVAVHMADYSKAVLKRIDFVGFSGVALKAGAGAVVVLRETALPDALPRELHPQATLRLPTEPPGEDIDLADVERDSVPPPPPPTIAQHPGAPSPAVGEAPQIATAPPTSIATNLPGLATEREASRTNDPNAENDTVPNEARPDGGPTLEKADDDRRSSAIERDTVPNELRSPSTPETHGSTS